VSKNVTKKGCPGKGGPFFLEARLMDRERKRKKRCGECPWSFYERNAGITEEGLLTYLIIKRLHDGEPIPAKRLA
jgi:hypothetical protein